MALVAAGGRDAQRDLVATALAWPGLAWLQERRQASGSPPPRVCWGGVTKEASTTARGGLDLLRCWEGEVVCLDITRAGHPRHLLFTRALQPLLLFSGLPHPCPGSPADTRSTCS